ncbi:MAG: large conductance mechanosensitive channel protein MscL [Ilumatobacter sp.]|nr:large conductance mechanosensitive channel protein MscL [Ilumatobacter sp.]
MGLLRDFRHYLFTARALDLAIGVVIGVAFGTVIKSFVDNLVSPLMSVIGNFDFSELSVTLRGGEFFYGRFINDVIAFLLVAVTVFLAVVRPKRSYEAKLEEDAESTVTCDACLSTIPAAARRCAFCREERTVVGV